MRYPSSASGVTASSALGKRSHEVDTGQGIVAGLSEKRPCLPPIGAEREPDKAGGSHVGLPDASARHVTSPRSGWDGSQAASTITTPWHDNPFDLSYMSPQAQGELTGWPQPAGDFDSLLSWEIDDWTLFGGEQMHSTTGYGQL